LNDVSLPSEVPQWGLAQGPFPGTQGGRLTDSEQPWQGSYVLLATFSFAYLSFGLLGSGRKSA